MKGYRLKRTAGFSLLELMVVVAIIGVLAAVAVPRFNIFRARARQAEAKSNLGVIFTLQEAFKIDKEQYYDGVATTWGGAGMKKAQAVGYRSGGTPTNVCPANKLGFRLANCDSARYKYWIREADEHSYLTVAWAASDVTAKRIFPGCKGSNTTVVQPAHSTSGSKKCQKTTVNTAGVASHADNTIAALTATETGGDAFCLDHQRTVDNFRDIVGDAQCVN